MTERFAYCTLVTSQDYVFAAQTLSKSLKKVTNYPLVVIVNKHIHYEPLNSYFDEIVPVEPLVSDDSRIELLERPLESTYTKFYAWTLDYEKVVYLDADMLILKCIDDLFAKPELSAAPDVGWPDCFNSGLMVLCPSFRTFEHLRFQATSQGSFDGADQGILNDFFPEWNRLPFLYNVTVSVEPVYSYKPAYLRFKDKVKVLHFFGNAKPWNHHGSHNSVVNDLLSIWWSFAHEGDNQSGTVKGRSIEVRKLQKPSGHNDSDEPNIISPDPNAREYKTIVIDHHEYVIDNDQNIPYNPNFQLTSEKRQTSSNNANNLGSYKIEWNYEELYGKKKPKSPKKKKFFKTDSWANLDKLKKISGSEFEEEDFGEESAADDTYIAKPKENLFDKKD
eukprot:NODE_442_length_7350_cov_0.498552.p2 type:complete len:391 gc:universal NODE_442_length_7350_cov_0.498552:3402-2230(-)